MTCQSCGGLPRTYSTKEVCEAFAISSAALTRLISDGKVGYYLAKRQRRFLPENIDQLKAAIVVRPRLSDPLDLIGLTSRSAARHRRLAGQC